MRMCLGLHVAFNIFNHSVVVSACSRVPNDYFTVLPH